MLNDLYFYLAKHPRFMYSAYQLAEIFETTVENIWWNMSILYREGNIDKVRIYKRIPTEKDSGVYYGIKI